MTSWGSRSARERATHHRSQRSRLYYDDFAMEDAFEGFCSSRKVEFHKVECGEGEERLMNG